MHIAKFLTPREKGSEGGKKAVTAVNQTADVGLVTSSATSQESNFADKVQVTRLKLNLG